MIDRKPFENERKMLNAVIARLQDIPDDELADAGELAGEMAEFYQSFNKNVQLELLARMAQAGRKLLVTDNWRCERVAAPVYEYADGGTQTRRVVRSIVGDAEAERYVTWEPPKPSEGRWKVNTVALKALMGKVSDDEAEAIRATYQVLEKSPKVTFTRVMKGNGDE